MTELELNRPVEETEALASPLGKQWSYGHAVLFTGHMIDHADRAEPRFPASAEGRTREAIHAAVSATSRQAAGEVIGLAAAASGGDLLFHEVCFELDIPTRVLLALPVEEFEAASVAPAGADWVRRYHALLDQHGPENVLIMGAGDGLLEGDPAGETDNIWQRANLWMIEQAVALAPKRTLLALWDGKTGDGPGGTEHFVEIAAAHGVRLAPLIAMQSLLE
jgi:hypothetical protein